MKTLFPAAALLLAISALAATIPPATATALDGQTVTLPGALTPTP